MAWECSLALRTWENFIEVKIQDSLKSVFWPDTCISQTFQKLTWNQLCRSTMLHERMGSVGVATHYVFIIDAY